MTKTLADYAKHDDHCASWITATDGIGNVSNPCRCSCGLAALVSGEGESRREKEKLMRAPTTRESSASLTHATTTEGRMNIDATALVRESFSKAFAVWYEWKGTCDLSGWSHSKGMEFAQKMNIAEQAMIDQIGRVSSSLSEASPDTAQDDEGCQTCGGTGELSHDCGEDTCCCLDKDGPMCPTCGGMG